MVPEGATVLEPVGTAPGLVVPPPPARDRPWSSCPGRRASCSRCGRTRSSTEAFRAARRRRDCSTASASCASSASPSPRSRRRCGSIEEEGVPIDRLEITTCLRRGEIEIATRWEPADEDVYARLRAPRARTARPRAVLRRRLDHRRAGRGPASRAAGAHRGGGGVVHRRPDGRAADRPRRVLGVRAGGVTAYSDAAKRDLVGSRRS